MPNSAKTNQKLALAVRGSNHTGMRQFNERIVLQAVRQNGAMPKADLARLTQLSTQTVAIIVDRLMADGLLLKNERIRGKIGQPSVPISLNPDGAFSVGIQVGRRGLEILVTNFLGEPQHAWKHLYDYPHPQTVLSKITEGLVALANEMGERWAKVVGIGLTAPLSLHQWADVLANPTKPPRRRWHNGSTSIYAKRCKRSRPCLLSLPKTPLLPVSQNYCKARDAV